MMPFLDEVRSYLIAQNVGTSASILLSSKTVVPAGDGPYMVIIETGGSGPDRTQNNTATQRPTAQISVRATSYPIARAMLYAAYNALGGPNGIYNMTLSGTFYLSITSRNEPNDIGVDDINRAMIAFNIDAQKQAS